MTRVVDHLPEFRLADPRGVDITVRQLLEQTSGLADSQVHELSREQPDSLADVVWQAAREDTSRSTPAPTSSGSTSDLGDPLGHAMTQGANTARRLAARP